MTSPALRARYLTDSVTTASPAQLLVMLYDRLVLDVVRAEDALRAGDRDLAGQRLMHAQDIVIELRSTLDTSTWSGAAGLAQLYGFLLAELIAANVRGDADKVAACRALIEPLRDAWREAAASTSPQPAGTRAA
jgi:flagellar secretion chaperone FliS